MDFHRFQRFWARFWPRSGSKLLPNAFIFVDFGGYEQFLNVRENLRENLRENVRENLRGPHANFGWFSGGTDRGFSTIFKDSYIFQRFCTRFWSLEESELLPKTFIFRGFRYGPEQFSDENPQNFGAWGEVLPERGQKRSGHENHAFLQSVTLTCSKHDFSSNFVGYWSRIFDDFQGFSYIS